KRAPGAHLSNSPSSTRAAFGLFAHPVERSTDRLFPNAGHKSAPPCACGPKIRTKLAAILEFGAGRGRAQLERLTDRRNRSANETKAHPVRTLEAYGLHRRHRPQESRREVRGEHHVRRALEHLEFGSHRTRRLRQVRRSYHIEHHL